MLRLQIAIYNSAIFFYSSAIRLASITNKKASGWIRGRKNWREELKAFDNSGKLVWMHCASLGEFEQGRPILESIRKKHPEITLLLTFFSPSGYEVRKNFEGVDKVLYLPVDTKRNAKDFISLSKPNLAIFIKYEFWYHYLAQLHNNKIPTILVSGAFRPSQIFFRWYGWLHKKMLGFFSHIFVLHPRSEDLLNEIGIKQVSYAPDTRFDRVRSISETRKSVPDLDQFFQDKMVICAGSTWPKDEELIASYFNNYPDNLTWIIAPHNINEATITSLKQRFSGRSMLYSESENGIPSDCNVLIIDNIGMLSSLYGFADMAYIGGGFNAGIHNILEAGVYSIPVIFGPKFHKFKEAEDLLNCNGAFSISDYQSFENVLNKLIKSKGYRAEAGQNAGKYITENLGGTTIIMKYLEEVITSISLE